MRSRQENDNGRIATEKGESIGLIECVVELSQGSVETRGS